MNIEEHVYARPVGEFCRRELLLCAEDDPVQQAALSMAQRGISSTVVCRAGEPVGIFTDRDLRKKVVAVGGDPGSLRAGAIMSSPLVTVREQDFLFEAVYQMSRHGIHRVAVVDGGGRLCGMLTESDLIRLQTSSPQLLVRRLEGAQGVAELRAVHQGVRELALALHRVGVPTPELMRLIAQLNDQITQRLVALLRRERFPDLPQGFAWVVLGSEGRGEQTLKSDQDNALILAAALAPAGAARLEAFAEALSAALAEIGVPECPGGMMAKNPFWRRDLSAWCAAADQWMAEPDRENIQRFCMLCDLRSLAGDPALEQALRAHIAARAPQQTVLLMQLAERVTRATPPFGLFGRFRLDRAGAFRGRLDLKKAGLFALTEGVRALGLSIGLVGGGTLEKLAPLRAAGLLSAEQAEDLRAGYELLCQLRLRAQLEALAAGTELSNHIVPDRLNRIERERLRETFKVVQAFKAFLRSHFRLDVSPG